VNGSTVVAVMKEEQWLLTVSLHALCLTEDSINEKTFGSTSNAPGFVKASLFRSNQHVNPGLFLVLEDSMATVGNKMPFANDNPCTIESIIIITACHMMPRLRPMIMQLEAMRASDIRCSLLSECDWNPMVFLWMRSHLFQVHGNPVGNRSVAHNAKRALKQSTVQDSPLSLGESLKMHSKLCSDSGESFKTLH